MTNYKPPSRDREPASDRFKRVYNEQLEQPTKRVNPVWRAVSVVFVALLVGTALLCVVGVMVWLVQWIDSML